jgi:hypothetical protein
LIDFRYWGENDERVDVIDQIGARCKGANTRNPRERAWRGVCYSSPESAMFQDLSVIVKMYAYCEPGHQSTSEHDRCIRMKHEMAQCTNMSGYHVALKAKPVSIGCPRLCCPSEVMSQRHKP